MSQKLPKVPQVTENKESDKLSLVDKKSQVQDIGQLAEFIVAQTAKSRAEVFDALPSIVKALSEKAKTGDTRAATLVLAFVSETLSAPAARSTSKPSQALTEAMNWLPKGGAPVNGKATLASPVTVESNSVNSTLSSCLTAELRAESDVTKLPKLGN